VLVEYHSNSLHDFNSSVTLLLLKKKTKIQNADNLQGEYFDHPNLNLHRSSMDEATLWEHSKLIYQLWISYPNALNLKLNLHSPDY
jgi:hypothetical protein